MSISLRFRGAILLCLLCTPTILRADAEIKVPGGSTMHIPLGRGWEDHSTPSPDDKHPPVFQFDLPTDDAANLRITPIPPGKVAPTDDDLKKASTAIAAAYAKGSVEKKTILEEVRKGDNIGYVSSYTDASGGKSGFKNVTVGVVRVGKQMVAFTLLYNGKNSPARGGGLEMMTSIMIGGTEPGPVVVPSPDEAWTVTIDGKWLTNQENSDKKSRRKTVDAADAPGGWVLSIYMEPAAKQPKTDAATARDYFQGRLRKSPLPISDSATSTVGEAEVVEYTLKFGAPQKNANAYLSHEGMWIDVHVSKPNYDEVKDRAALDAMLKSIRIEKPVVKGKAGK